MSLQVEWRFGAHRAFLAGPDLLVDIARSSLAARVRKYLAEEIEPAWFFGVVYVGANLRARLLAKALSILVLFSGKMPYRMAFAADDEAAEAILVGWRKHRPVTA